MATKINNGGYQQNFNPQTGKYESGKTKRPTYISNQRKLVKSAYKWQIRQIKFLRLKRQ